MIYFFLTWFLLAIVLAFGLGKILGKKPPQQVAVNEESSF